MKRLLRHALNRFGYDLVQRNTADRSDFSALTDLSEADRGILAAARPFTMTSVARMATLLESVRHIANNKVDGDVVECGVWRGGSMMIVSLMLKALGDEDRALRLYDTFEGMSEPSEEDVDHAGSAASDQLASTPKGEGIWCDASIEDVQTNLASTGYPTDRIHYYKGRVEDTIPTHLPEKIALLRLDTDWYESTRHELIHLFPLLSPNGILIIDDYGYWQGARKAVDEYFSGQDVYLHRIDNTGRLIVKPAS